MTDWQVWAAIGFGLLIFEIFLPGFVLGCLSIGAFAAAVAALPGLSLEFQLLIFGIVSLIAFFTIRPIVLKRLASDENVKTNIDSLAGRKALVTQAFDSTMKKGRVAVDGDDWLSYIEGESVPNVGDAVIIVRVESNSLIVKTL